MKLDHTLHINIYAEIEQRIEKERNLFTNAIAFVQLPLIDHIFRNFMFFIFCLKQYNQSSSSLLCGYFSSIFRYFISYLRNKKTKKKKYYFSARTFCIDDRRTLF